MAILTKANAGFTERRYWGDRELPTSKSDFFGLVTQPAPSGDGTVATIRIYGPIDSWGGFWGVSAKDVMAITDKLGSEVTQLIVRINSPGGEVWEGLAILNALRAHKATVTAVVDGIAASAASVIAAGCDETVMSPGTQMMIHSPWTFSIGSAEDLRKDAEILDTIQDSLIEIYRAKAGDADWTAMLNAEKWFTADAAVEQGLADRVAVVPDAGVVATAEEPEVVTLIIVESDDVEDSAAGTKWLKSTTKAHRATKTPVASASGNPSQKEKAVDNTPDLVEETTEETTPIEGTSDAETTPTDITEEDEDGTVVLDKSTFKELQRQASVGRAATAQAHENDINTVLDQAIKAGKFAETRRGHFEDRLRADFEGAKEVIAKLVSLTEETGYDASAESIKDESTDPEFEAAHQRTLAKHGMNRGA